MKFNSDPILRNRVKRVIDQWDPISLLCIGAPPDEYDHEIDDIADALPGIKNAQELATFIKSRFIHGFDEQIFHRDFAECLIIAQRILAGNVEPQYGDWVRTGKPGIWRVERIVDFFFERRSSLEIEKIDNICPIVIAKRIRDIDQGFPYEAEAFKSILTTPLTEEEKKQNSKLIDNKDELVEFEKFQKVVNYFLNLFFSVEEDSKEYFNVLIQNMFATIDRGLTNEEILLKIENDPLKKFYEGGRSNIRIEFVSYNYELEDSEFIYRSYKIANR